MLHLPTVMSSPPPAQQTRRDITHPESTTRLLIDPSQHPEPFDFDRLVKNDFHQGAADDKREMEGRSLDRTERELRRRSDPGRDGDPHARVCALVRRAQRGTGLAEGREYWDDRRRDTAGGSQPKCVWTRWSRLIDSCSGGEGQRRSLPRRVQVGIRDALGEDVGIRMVGLRLRLRATNKIRVRKVAC